MYNTLFISLDKDLLNTSSRVFDRHKEYAQYFNKLYINVLSNNSKSIKYKNLGIFSFGGSFKLLILLRSLIKLNKFLKLNSIDVISTQDPFFAGLIGVIISRIYKIPLNIQVHAEFFCNKYFRKESVKNQMYYLFGKNIIKLASTIRCDSYYENKNLVKKEFDSYFCPISVEIKDFNINRNYKLNNNILFIGRLVKQKNIHLLLSAFSILTKEYNELKLIIVGEGHLKSKLTSFCRYLNISENIEFLSQKNKKEIIELIKNSDFVVLPSFYEGWSLVSMEVLASATPIITTKVGAGDILIKNMTNGIIVDINNEEQLYKAMKLLLINKKLRQKLGKEGQKTVLKKEWSKEYLTKKWIKILIKTAEIKTC